MYITYVRWVLVLSFKNVILKRVESKINDNNILSGALLTVAKLKMDIKPPILSFDLFLHCVFN